MMQTGKKTYAQNKFGRMIVGIIRPQSKAVRLVLLAVCGAAAGIIITFPSVMGACLQWIVYIPAALVMISMSEDDGGTARGRIWRMYRYGFLFFMTEYLVIYHWFFSFYPLDFTGMNRASAVVVVIVAWLGLSFLASVAGGAVFALFGALTRGRAVHDLPILRPILGGALFALFEWVETIGWMGVPWGRIALGQLSIDGAPTVRVAALLGSYFVAFAVVSVAFLLAESILSAEKRRTVCYSVFAFLFITADLLLGCAAAYVADLGVGGYESQTVKVAAIQANISSRDKFEITVDETVDIYLDLVTCAADGGAELILTPESAFPWSLADDAENLSLFCDLARKYETRIVLGCLDGQGEGEENIFIYILSNGEVSDTVYSKRHLVPFGEYMPWRRLLSTLIPPLSEISILGYDLAAGEGTAIVDLGDGILGGGLICFDSIYEELALSSAREGANILLLGTNDSWFSDSAAVYMHNAQARLRAIETGLPIVRAANTGISSVIDKSGRELCRLEPLETGIVTTCVELGTASLYSKTGNIFVYIFIAVCAVSAIYNIVFYVFDCRRKKKRRHTSTSSRI